MQLLNGTDLARELRVSKARVSQYLSEGRLNGCYTGEGRARRFDVARVKQALLGQLDPGQMMGNGAATKAALQDVALVEPDEVERQPVEPDRHRDGPLAGRDPDRYALARTQVAEEEARSKRRANALAEGQFVLAAEVERVTAALMAQEVAEFESVLRTIARRIADLHGLDFKAVRQLAMDEWRAHRGTRSSGLAEQADAADLSNVERAADF